MSETSTHRIIAEWSRDADKCPRIFPEYFKTWNSKEIKLNINNSIYDKNK